MIDALMMANMKEKPQYGFLRKKCTAETCKKDCDKCDKVSDEMKEARSLNSLILMRKQDVMDTISKVIHDLNLNNPGFLDSYDCRVITAFAIMVAQYLDDFELEEIEED